MISSSELLASINVASEDPSVLHIWWLGQMGFVLKSGESIIYIDPFLSAHPRRVIPPLLDPSKINHATLVLGSHDHKDHIDREVWPLIAQKSSNAIFIVPSVIKSDLIKNLDIETERLVGMTDNETLTISGVKLSGVASAHEFLDQDKKTGLFPYMGFIIQFNGFTIYHAGDTCRYEGLETKLRQWKIDIMILPINGRDATRYSNGCIGNMTYQEAVDLAGTLHPSLVIPGHYDMFAHNAENPKNFTEYMKVKYPSQSVYICEHGVCATIHHEEG